MNQYSHSKAYWLARMERAQAYTDANIEALEEEYKKIYVEAMNKLKQELNIIESKEKLTRTDVYNMKRYKIFSAQLSQIVKGMQTKITEATQSSIEENYRQVSEALSFFEQVDERKLKTVINEVWCADGLNWSQRIWKNQTLLKSKVKEAMVDCIVKGYNSSKTAQAISEQFNTSFFNAKRLANTELSHIETIAAQDRYKEYGIKQWEVLPTHDEKTCPICSGKAGEKYSIEETPVPLHPRCRCAMIPVVEF